MSRTITPPAVIGILGGGQLGRMLALQARQMGYGIICLDPTPNSPCGQVADRQIVAKFADQTAAVKLAASSDIVTYEFENIPASIVEAIRLNSYIPQGYHVLEISQNRLAEKRSVINCGVLVAPFCAIETRSDLATAIETMGYPSVLKTVRGGYDGKGQILLATARDLAQVEEMLLTTSKPWILEKHINYTKELSVIVARSTTGQIETFPLIENIHHQGILHLSLMPARVSDAISRSCLEIGKRIAESLEVVGLIAIELFLTADGQVLVNEIAPRPHNSGHVTMQACSTCQFEQHIRSICGLPLDKPAILRPTVMANVLGEHLSDILEKANQLSGDCKLHLYGKAVPQDKRKMGHLNVSADSVETALDYINSLAIWPREVH